MKLKKADNTAGPRLRNSWATDNVAKERLHMCYHDIYAILYPHLYEQTDVVLILVWLKVGSAEEHLWEIMSRYMFRSENKPRLRWAYDFHYVLHASKDTNDCHV